MSHQKADKDVGEQPKAHRIRITLTSRKVAALEKVCRELIDRAQSKGLAVKGPVRLPVRLNHTNHATRGTDLCLRE